MTIGLIASVGFTGLIAAGIITHICRTWQLIRADKEGSVQLQLLDGLDQVQTQLYSVSDRLERLVRKFGAGESTLPELPPGIEV